MRHLLALSALLAYLLLSSQARGDCRGIECNDPPQLCLWADGSEQGTGWQLTVSNRDTGQLLFDESGATGVTHAYGTGEMQSLPAPYDVPIDIELTADSDRIEAMLSKIHDPEQRKLDAHYYASLSEQAGSSMVADLIIPSLTTSRSIPYPGSAGTGATSLPDGRVAAARVYDRGACSAVKPIQPLFDALDGVAGDHIQLFYNHQQWIGAVELDWTAVVSYLGHPAGSPTVARGGFIWDHHWQVWVDDLYPDMHGWTYGYYRFELDDGLLTIRPIDWHYSAATSPPNLTDFVNILIETYEDTLPWTFAGWAREDQTLRFETMSCDPFVSIEEQIQTCRTNMPSWRLTAGIRDGGEKLCLTDDEIDRAVAAFEDNWRCVPVLTNPYQQTFDGVCEQTLRAERLNTYPDVTELVWFDDKSPDNPVYALWVAFQDPSLEPDLAALLPDPPTLDELCHPRDDSVHDRAFAYHAETDQIWYYFRQMW